MRQAEQTKLTAFDASSWKLGIVVAQFNKHISDRLEQSALTRARNYKIPRAQIDIINVAGSIEVPLVLQRMAKSGKYNALLALGCVIRGETAHFDYVCKFVTEGILRVQLDYDAPIGFGVLTCNTEAQAKARLDLGGEYLDAVLHQAKALQQV